MTHDEMLEADAIAWANIEKLDALYTVFDLYCEEVGINMYDADDVDTKLSADEILEGLPTDSPHRRFICAFIEYLEAM